MRKFVQTMLKWKLDKTESIEQCKAISRHARGLYWVQIFHDVMHWSISWFSHDVTEIQTKKLLLLVSFYFHVVLQHLNTNKFSVQKGSLFCDTGHLNFRAFVWRGIQLTARKALMWVKNITDFGRFCYLNIPCLRINITLIFMSSSSGEFTQYSRKTQKLLVSSGHICAPERDTNWNMASPCKAS